VKKVERQKDEQRDGNGGRRGRVAKSRCTRRFCGGRWRTARSTGRGSWNHLHSKRGRKLTTKERGTTKGKRGEGETVSKIFVPDDLIAQEWGNPKKQKQEGLKHKLTTGEGTPQQ